MRSLLEGNIRAFAVRGLLLTLGQGLTGGLVMLYVKNVLGADALVIGSFTSLWCAVFVVFILLGGWVADRYDRKKTYLLGSALALPTPLIYA
ncbi:hypothetical protein DRO28_02265, partial [Candidatus Bathyarchaeota archaeon]